MPWLIGLAGLILLAFFVPIWIGFQYSKDGSQDELKLILQLWPAGKVTGRNQVIDGWLGKLSRRLRATFVLHGPAEGSQEKDPEQTHQPRDAGSGVEDIIASFNWAVDLMRRFLQGELGHGDGGLPPWAALATAGLGRIRYCEEFQWNTKLGTGGAAGTAIAAGSLWGLKGSLMALVAGHVEFSHPPQIQVTPDFAASGLQTFLHCIFRIHIGHAIIVGLRSVINAASAKGVRIVGQQKRTSSSH